MHKVGDVIFFNWKNPYMRLITLYNRIKYGEKGFAHVGIITEVSKDQVYIHEAINEGFVASWYNISYINELIKEKKCEIKRTHYKLEKVQKYANKYIGTKYGWLDIFSIIINIFTGAILHLTEDNQLICSEAVARILYDASNKEINFQEEYNKHYNLITPMDMYKSKYLKPLKNA